MRIVFMPGDGIGPEICGATVKVLECASKLFGLDLSFQEHTVGFASLASHGTTITAQGDCGLSIRHRNEAFARAHAAIESAVDALLRDPARRTPDLGGALGTRAFTDALCAQMENAKS